MKPFVLLALLYAAATVSVYPQLKQSDFQKAPTVADEAEAIRYFELGNACRDDDFNCRIEAFTRAIGLYPNFAEAYNNRGSAYLLSGRKLEALNDFSHAIAAKPSAVQALYNRAIIYSDSGEAAKAVADFQAVIKQQPELGLAFTGLGNVLLKQERYDAALLSFTRAIQLQPDFAANYFNRGLVYLLRDEFGKAEADFSKALIEQRKVLTRCKRDSPSPWTNRDGRLRHVRQHP